MQYRFRWIALSLIVISLGSFSYGKDNPPTKISFISQLPTADALVLGIYEGIELGPFANQIEMASGGDLTKMITNSGFKANQGESIVIPGPEGSGYKQILLVGMGSKEAKSKLDWQEIGGQSVQDALEKLKAVPALAFDVDLEAGAQLSFGAKLGSYYFDKYYTDSKRKKYQPQLTLVHDEAAELERLFRTTMDPIANAVWFTRDISNEPANRIYPQSFVKRWKTHFKGLDNVRIRVFDEADMLDMNMGAIYGVGRGSKRPPRLMIVEYNGSESDQAPVAIVGKGITFDTGGISLKNPPNMWNMKFDMSGAASAIGTVYALAKQKAKVNLVGVAALAENMPGGNAQRPGDVVTTMSGKTVQIRSTDAEGRLVLADGVYYADTEYQPALLIDLATLTGSAKRALGEDYAALFSRHQELIPDVITFGKQTGEEVWQLPLNKNHFKAIENEVADIMNSGPTAPGASAGAAFIGSFIRETTPWLHLDIAGVAYKTKASPLVASPGSTSFGIRLLADYITSKYVSKD